VGADREGDKTGQGERDIDEEEGVREGREDAGT
jgi:hypothetical protein